MAAPTKVNFKMYQGATFKEVLRWESSTKAYAPITGITKAAPMVITSTDHGIPVGWRGKITNVVGMKEVNSTEVYHTVTDTTSNTLTINAINSLGFTDYTSGGVFEYNVPTSLSGKTARMQVRSKLEDTATILELTTENGGIVIDNALKTITIVVSATATAALTFTSAVYSLELIEGSEVIPFIYGSITLSKEITR
jgi:hypothetical protein